MALIQHLVLCRALVTGAGGWDTSVLEIGPWSPPEYRREFWRPGGGDAGWSCQRRRVGGSGISFLAQYGGKEGAPVGGGVGGEVRGLVTQLQVRLDA